VTPVARVLALLGKALDVLTDEGADCALDVQPCRTAIYLGGEVPWDTCEDNACGAVRNGQLWAQLVGINPTAGGSDASNCPSYNWTGSIGIVRSIATLTASGPPSVDRIAKDAARQACDADAIFRAITCCPDAESPLREVTLSAWSPLGPSGACAGGAWTVRGRLDVCC
jgi:hypothetical protein